MTVPIHMKVVARGDFVGTGGGAPATGESWTFSLKFSRDAGGLIADAQANDVHVDAIFARIGEYISTSLFQDTVVLTGVSAYAIKADGLMEGNPNTFLGTGTLPRGTGTLHYPFQVATVVSTVAENRGPARFGRFFLPGPAVQLGADGRMPVGDVITLVSLTTDMLKDVSDEVDLGLDHSSELLNISSLGGGTRQTVDFIRIGRVYDTHRSRRTSLDEDYQNSGHIDW